MNKEVSEDEEKIKYIVFNPTTKDPEQISNLLVVNSDQEEDHGDIIDYSNIVPFNKIPEVVVKQIVEEYGFDEPLTEEILEEYNIICRAGLSIGIDEERGFEVTCSQYYFYSLESRSETTYVYGQGEYGRKWLKEVNDHLNQLGWNAEVRTV